MKLYAAICCICLSLFTSTDLLAQDTADTPCQIVFATWRDIFLINADGSNLVQLTDNSTTIHGGDDEPIWSPDGTKIAFRRILSPSGLGDIFVMDADGSNIVNLTNTGQIKNDWSPAWSPDSQSILYVSHDGGNVGIYRVATDSPNGVRLSDEDYEDFSPAWSPDGGEIVFKSRRDGNSEIYIMNADGSNQVNVTNSETNEITPSWLPNGTQIVFYTSRDGNSEIYIMNADGSNQVNVTNSEEDEILPIVSPNGKKILYFIVEKVDDEWAWHLKVIDADVQKQYKIQDYATTVGLPAWSPDSEKIVFVADDEEFKLYIYNFNDDSIRYLADGLSADWNPICSS